MTERFFTNPEDIQRRNKENRKTLDTAVKSGDKFQVYFAYAIVDIERDLGIKLSNIELVRLKDIAKQVLKEFEEQEQTPSKGSLSRIDPMAEISERFLFQSYGITSKELSRIFPEGQEALKHEYFNRKQARLHDEI